MSACFVYCCAITFLLMFLTDGESCSTGNLTDGAEHCCYAFVKIGNICKACPAGYFGKNCSQPCLPQLYGSGCTQKCTCSHCHPVFGCDARNETATQAFRKLMSTQIPDEVDYLKNTMETKTQDPSKLMTISVSDEVDHLKQLFSYIHLRIIIISCGTFISLVLLLLMVREIRRYILQ